MVWLIRRFATHIVGVSPGSLSHGYRRDWESDPRVSVIPNGLPPHVSDGPSDRIELSSSADEAVALHVGRRPDGVDTP